MEEHCGDYTTQLCLAISDNNWGMQKTFSSPIHKSNITGEELKAN